MEIKKELELEETKNTELNDDVLDTVSGGAGEMVEATAPSLANIFDDSPVGRTIF